MVITFRSPCLAWRDRRVPSLRSAPIGGTDSFSDPRPTARQGTKNLMGSVANAPYWPEPLSSALRGGGAPCVASSGDKARGARAPLQIRPRDPRSCARRGDNLNVEEGGEEGDDKRGAAFAGGADSNEEAVILSNPAIPQV